MNQRYKDKVVLVTGGAKGIGKAIVNAFAAEGAKVMIAARTMSYAEDLASQLQQQGCEADVVHSVNTDRALMKAMVEKTIERFGRLDIVVHSAAHWVQNDVVEMDEADFEEMMIANIQSLHWLSKDTFPYLSQAPDKGRLIFISSGSANRQFMPGLTCYASTKAYLNSFSRGLALELGKHNVLVNTIDPGLIASDRVKGNIDDTVLTALTANYPVPRAGHPEEIAAAALYLASNEAGYVTGSSLLVDGGGSMATPADLESVLANVER